MALEKSNYQKDKFRKLIPSKQINEGWRYYKTHEPNVIIGVRMNLNAVYLVVEKGGEPIINKDTKLPVMEWNQTIESKILTKEQYENIISSGFEDE